MRIVYRHSPDGAFVAGDSDTGFTAYAYPTSTHAQQAKRSAVWAEQTARKMLESRGTVSAYEYDRRNWQAIQAEAPYQCVTP
jgi:hypothetical protein